MQTVGDPQQSIVGKCAPNQRHSERQAVGFHSRRDCHRCEIEQVDKIGVVTEVAIQLKRRCLHLGNFVVRGSGRKQQEVHFFPNACSLAVQILKSVCGLERICGRVFRSTANNGFDGRIDGLWVTGKKVLDRGIALGDPWPAVQKFCHLPERLIIECDGYTADRFERGYCRLVTTRCVSIPKEFQRIRGRNTESKACRETPWGRGLARCRGTRVWIAVIEPARDTENTIRIRASLGKD